MRSLKSVFGVIGALLPIAYCGGLLYYFMQGNDLSGTVGQGLGPTVLGLGAIGLLFCVPLIFRLLKLAAPARPEPGARPADEEPASSFDADAALARYMARRTPEMAASYAAAEREAAGPRPTFGRKPV